ncbi:MAG TPA: serine/threonine-protein kinase, partial [Nannocystaceae bacterium]|nr:serine/threonine-protein kinase [Nannocystaceae bacterium]
MSEATPPIGPGTLLGGRYLLQRWIGAGGMGRVYTARHIALDRTFAVKILHSAFALDRIWLERFRREARATSSIGHENIIDITDIGLADDGSPFYVMEHLAGEPLDDTLRRDGPMPWERVQRIAAQLCDALAAAHHVGVIHRDIKLANIFHSPRARAPDFVKLLDFGIAKTLPRATAPATALTMTGEVFGTPGHMAPEQFCGGDIDARTDVYALAIVLYQLLSGHLPFPGPTPRVIVEKQL